MKRVAIVGGGPGGLFSAFLLKTKAVEPFELTIFEASSRLGGKLQTAHFESVDVPYEAGAAEIYQYGNDPLRLLIKEILGLPVQRMSGRAVVLDGHVIRDSSDLNRHFGPTTAKAVEEFDRLAHEARSYDAFYNCEFDKDNAHPLSNRSFASILDEVPDAPARRYLRVLVHSDLATEPETTSALYGIDNYLINDPDYCKLYSVKGGMSKFVEALRDSVNADYQIETVVRSIEKIEANESYRLEYTQDGKDFAEEFDAVAVALPMAWLPKIEFKGQALQDAMSDHVAHYDYPAHYLRVSILFREPFWGTQIDGSFFMVDAFGGACVYDEGTRLDVGGHGVLSWLLAGANAERESSRTDQELIEAALDSFPTQFGDARAAFVEGKVHRWLGAVNARPGGRIVKDLMSRHLPEPERHPRLYIVGDYMFDTSLNGVLDSADYMSDYMLDALKLKQLATDGEYFDRYLGRGEYAECYREAFDAQSIVDSIQLVWGEQPPYSLLDAGSASGLTVAAFQKMKIDARGIEVHPFIHALTTKRMKTFNILGDVCDLPYHDEEFDFVYDTCLAYVDPADLPRALSELKRVTRFGLIIGSVVADFKPELIDQYRLKYCVRSFKSLAEWNRLLGAYGFEAAIHSDETLDELTKLENPIFDGVGRFQNDRSLGQCFLSKVPFESRSVKASSRFQPSASSSH